MRHFKVSVRVTFCLLAVSLCATSVFAQFPPGGLEVELPQSDYKSSEISPIVYVVGAGIVGIVLYSVYRIIKENILKK